MILRDIAQLEAVLACALHHVAGVESRIQLNFENLCCRAQMFQRSAAFISGWGVVGSAFLVCGQNFSCSLW